MYTQRFLLRIKYILSYFVTLINLKKKLNNILCFLWYDKEFSHNLSKLNFRLLSLFHFWLVYRQNGEDLITKLYLIDKLNWISIDLELGREIINAINASYWHWLGVKRQVPIWTPKSLERYVFKLRWSIRIIW